MCDSYRLGIGDPGLSSRGRIIVKPLAACGDSSIYTCGRTRKLDHVVTVSGATATTASKSSDAAEN